MNEPNTSPEGKHASPRRSARDEAADWLLRLQEESDDPFIRTEFQAWLSEHPANREEFRKIEDMWGSSALHTALKRTDLPKEKRRTSSSRYLLIAASTVLLAVGASQLPSLLLYWQSDYVTAAGVQKNITLPDGSHMLLNTASAAALEFDGPERGVRLLEGEAYFDVQSDPARPFKVRGRFSEVEVTGTAFTVRADDDGDVVVLQRGGVDVRSRMERRNEVRLMPGQSVNASATALSQPVEANMASALAWVDGRIVFHNQPIADVLKELGRYYSGRILVLDRRIGQVTVSGSHGVDNAAEAIATLAEAAGASVTHLPGLFILR